MTLTATQKARRAAARSAQPPAQKPKQTVNKKGKGKQPQKQLPRKQATKAAMPVVEASNLTTFFSTASFGTKGGIRIRGRDPISVVSQAVGANYANIANFVVSPSRFEGTRIQAYANIYERYRFEKMRYIWSPTCPTSTPGGLLMSYDVDATDPTPDATEIGFRTYLGHRCSVTFAPWEVAVLDVTPDPVDKQFFYTGTLNQTLGGVDERLSFQGQFYLAQTSPVTNATGVLWLEYDIVFDEPQLNPIQNNWISTQVSANNAPADSQNPLAGAVLSNNANQSYLPMVVDAAGHQAVTVPPLTRCIMTFLGQSNALLTGIGAQVVNQSGQVTGGVQDLAELLSGAQYFKRWVVTNLTAGKVYFHPYLASVQDAAHVVSRAFIAELIPTKGAVF